MAKPKSKQMWFHQADITENLNFALGELVPTIPIAGVVSRALAPKALASVMICLDPAQIKTLERRMKTLANTKKKLKQSREKCQQLDSAILAIASENRELEARFAAAESLASNLQYNLDVLTANINDQELMLASAKAPHAGSNSGLAKLSDYGGVGKALPGGLPGLGKK
ncbi:MAG: hypothetical protein AB7E72_20515 [Lysobacterales bacterium]